MNFANDGILIGSFIMAETLGPQIFIISLVLKKCHPYVYPAIFDCRVCREILSFLLLFASLRRSDPRSRFLMAIKPPPLQQRSEGLILMGIVV